MFFHETVHKSLSIFILFISPITYYILTRKITAPFGKHSSTSKQINQPNWGPSCNPKFAWFLFESPNLLWCLFAYQYRDETIFDRNYGNIILFALFVVHYVNRCIVYPLRMNNGGTSVNLAVLSSAFFFCCINGL